MKKQQVKIGGVYSAKITDKVVPVRIDAERSEGGGWDATNLHTNRKVRIKSAQKLRSRITVPPNDNEPTPAKKPVKKKLTAAERKELVAKRSGKADDVPDTLPEPAGATKDAKRGKKRNTGERRAKVGKRDGVEAKPLSLLNAAAQILAESTEPLNTREMVAQATERGLWSPRAGKTPASTLYASILREMKTKGDEARFTKVERGRFTLSAAAPGNKKGA
ncbi:MAG: hypothetical protein GC159_11460 [Phycisphaera sp.]|nr:hypothetical protein [Phycisphaera sp.]